MMVISPVALWRQAEATRIGTATPVPSNLATPTPYPDYLIIVPTPTPENEATAQFLVALATAYVQTTGTPTPLPLEAITATRTVDVPAVICRGTAQGKSYLVLEYITFSSENTEAKLGRQLAQMHRHTASKFGWPSDNFIGTTKQVNSSHTCGNEFWRNRRLAYQLDS